MARGQSVIEGIIVTFVGLILLIGLRPAIAAAINAALPGSDDLTQMLLVLIIPLMFIGIVYKAFFAPQAARVRGYPE